ncbi:filamentous hemagglutinin N-terminal domain-containing protein [Candidatus Halobeggiatoa sp. HSG11]|nr:filamentous hemagglutinin N-terminal domain-containing protein [Candidatus Halobeggiatoa sp. HSG11]
MKYFMFIISLFTYNISQADIALDGTLGPKVSLEGPDYNINADLGQQHGNNLFHSFEKFGINVDEIATFSGPDSINNVISRVTGGNSSYIDGTISSTMPNADMYLINPAGLVFGKNAVLDVQGSFHASTANTLRLQDGGEFNATAPSSSILTVAPVSSFGFLSNSSSIVTEQARLSVPLTKTLSLIGNNIQINNSVLQAEFGHINIASIAQGDVAANNLVLSGTPSNLNIQNSSVTVKNGGNIFIRAGEFLLNNTAIQTNTFGNADAGIIDVQVNNLTAVKGSRFISQTRGSGQGGEIAIKVKELAEFSGEYYKKIEDKTIFNKSGISATAYKDGNSGTIKLESNSLNLKNGASISVNNRDQGQGGNIDIIASESINLSGTGLAKNGSSITANTGGKSSNAGKGGNISINTKQLELKDGGTIGANSYGVGQGGAIKIKTNIVDLSGEDKHKTRRTTSRISTLSMGSGNGGTLSLEADELHLKDGAILLAATSGANSTGKGGNIELKVNNLIKLEGLSKTTKQGSNITAAAQSRNKNAGDGGVINLTTKRLQLTDGTQIIAATFGPGQGGQINIDVSDKTLLSGKNPLNDKSKTAIVASTLSSKANAGDAGNINMKIGSLHLDDEAEVNAETKGPGLGGSIKIQADNVKLTNGGTITALSQATGYAGNIELDLSNLLVMKNGNIETKAEFADGGNLTLKASKYVYLVDSRVTTSVSEEFGGGGNIIANPEFVVLNNATIFAKAKKGSGGNIDVTTTGIYNFTYEPIEEVINASSEFGTDGIVTIKTPDNNADEGLFSLPTTLFDASKFINTPCAQKVATNISSFILVPSEGTSNATGDMLSSGIMLSELQKPSVTAKYNNNLPTLALASACLATKQIN